ncbi:tumor necrosis factor receptor superfamily member 1B isoform 2-T2 [Aulostomus maculatus]
MKDILVLLFVLNVLIPKVYSLPYPPDSNGNCQIPEREYRSETSKLCCQKCAPGSRQKKKCSDTVDTECEPCGPGLYMETWNYAPNCFSCPKCKPNKGLQIAKICSPTERNRCMCKPGMYCIMGYDGDYCNECQKYQACKAGYGVSVPGTANSNVKCEQCPGGTFSDTVSHTDSCRLHTDCHGSAVVRKGNSTSDTVCGSSSQPEISNTEQPAPISMATRTASATLDPAPISELRNSTTARSPVLDFIEPTKSSAPGTSNERVVAAVIGVILLFIVIAIILLVLYKLAWKKDAAKFHPKVDANANCETGDKINQSFVGETQWASFSVISQEQQCLLQKGEASSDHSQSSSNTETLTRTQRCSSHESIGPLQSTIALNDLPSPLSESLTLLSNTESSAAQPSILSQSSQSTNPHIISPVTTSPHVNVNITFHIGNGSCGTPSITPTDVLKTDSKLPFGEEEECSSIPQQEDGKHTLTSVQESASYSECECNDS